MFGSKGSSNRLDRRRKERRKTAAGQHQRQVNDLFADLSTPRLQPRTSRTKTGSSETARSRASRGTSRQPMARSRHEPDSGMPPVMVRGSVQGLPAPARRPSQKTRRRFDVALSVPGAEMRLPALPQVHLGWRLVSALIVAVLAALLYQLWNSPGYRVQTAQVDGLQRLASADVNAVLDIAGESIFTLNEVELQEKIQAAFPEFARVKVEIALRNKVRVQVDERLPILTWRQEGRTLLVDANGYAFPQREAAPAGPELTVEAASAPPGGPAELLAETGPATGLGVLAGAQLSAAAPAPFITVEMVSAILSMRGQAPAGVAVVYDAQHGLGWKDAQGWDVYFGDVRDMGMKLNVYKALIARLAADGVQPVFVSVEHVHAPYYRLER